MAEVKEGNVVLVSSRQESDQDFDYNSCSRILTGSFLVGPKRRPFALTITVENVEGDDRIELMSDIVQVDGDECTYEMKRIHSFLDEAGLADAPASGAESWGIDIKTEEDRLKWVFASLFDDIGGLFIAKHGRTDDNFGLTVGMDQEAMCILLGFEI